MEEGGEGGGGVKDLFLLILSLIEQMLSVCALLAGGCRSCHDKEEVIKERVREVR